MNKLLQVISGSQIKDVGHGKFTVTIANPLTASYAGMPPAGTTLPGAQGPDVVLSVTPAGGVEGRPAGTAGSWEQCVKSNGLLVYEPFGEATFVLPFAVYGA